MTTSFFRSTMWKNPSSSSKAMSLVRWYSFPSRSSRAAAVVSALAPEIAAFSKSLPQGYSLEVGGTVAPAGEK